MTQPLEHELVPYKALQCLSSGRVLILAPHPDDEVLGCGGAIMRHAQAGDPIHVVVVTDGAFGPNGDEVAYRLTREREARCAAGVLGYGEPSFWGLPDRGLEYGESLIARVGRCIEELCADLVYAPSWWEIHPDHSALALATAEAVRRSARPCTLAMYEVGSPLHPNRLLDITDIRDRKQEAILCFESQVARQPYHEHIAALNRFRTYTLPATVLAAEAYRVVTREELRSGPSVMIPPGHDFRRTSALRRRPEPLVSVIIPATHRCLPEQTLDAIALQTYPHIEIIVVATRADKQNPLPKWWGRFPVHVVSEEIVLPYGQAMNRGLAAAHGQYLAFPGENDIFEPEHLAMLVERLGRSPDSRCVYSGVRVDHLLDGEVNRSEILSRPFNKHRLMVQDDISINTVLIDRDLYEAGCRFDETLDACVGWDFLLQVCELTQLIHVDRITVRSTKALSFGALGRDETDRPGVAASAIFDKWRNLWTGLQWADVVGEYEQSLAQKSQEVSTLRGDLEAIRKQLLQSEGQVQTLAVQIAEALPIPKEIDRDAHVSRDDNQETARRTQELAESLDAVYRSTSWRVTAPMRSVSRWLRRARGGSTLPGA